MRVTSTARKDGRWWVVQCDEYPGAISQVTQLSQAAAHQREAIAFVAGVDEDDVDVEVRPALDLAISELLGQARDERQHAETLVAAAAEHTRKAVADLHGTGYTLRDIGTILGVSHQRAAQLLGSPS